MGGGGIGDAGDRRWGRSEMGGQKLMTSEMGREVGAEMSGIGDRRSEYQ